MYAAQICVIVKDVPDGHSSQLFLAFYKTTPEIYHISKQENQPIEDDFREKPTPELYYISKPEKIPTDDDDEEKFANHRSTPPRNDDMNKMQPVMYYISGNKHSNSVTASPMHDRLNTPINNNKNLKNPVLYYIRRQDNLSEDSSPRHYIKQDSNINDEEQVDRLPVAQSSSRIPMTYSPPPPKKQAVAFEIYDDNDTGKKQPQPLWKKKSDHVSVENVIINPSSKAANSIQRKNQFVVGAVGESCGSMEAEGATVGGDDFSVV
ncbi:unnamed protein product [Didymodactylos carnosus]|uniref:Uncharacterized protein n=1 Tax=Didymodactylos carnosus TaxID=1234261 RepID=A0A814IY71_9BILA|nr:unnamed protein product [Didymodactylos carnosus]CAF1030595.1 unnamed protein product [Didymodactylos carnosus]CAF3616676.1 unnamed protein product [Didymodactylos carnosus]CAF3801476.1 unnamed protein product [Didymodactylos carnosus]